MSEGRLDARGDLRRAGWVIQLKPGAREEYRRLHENVWPGVQARLRDGGVERYTIFMRDPRVTLLIDDAEVQRYVAVSGAVEVREDLEQLLPIFRRTRENHGVFVPNDAEYLASFEAEDRVLLVITPNGPMESWRANGFT